MDCSHICKIYQYENEKDPANIYCDSCGKFLGKSEHKNILRVKYFIKKLALVINKLTKQEKSIYYQLKNIPTKNINWNQCEQITNLYQKYSHQIKMFSNPRFF